MAISWWANRKIVVTAITVTVATVTTIVRFTGGFESLEIKRYDYFFSKRAISDWDERIVIVGYTEDDREKYGESAPDKEMAQVLEKLRFSSATTVGLFFKRDQKPSIAEDRDKLNQQIELMDNLIRTDGGDKLSPEPDNIIRKIQLYKQSSSKPSIVYKVAKHYLQNKGARIKENQIPPSITINYSEEKEVTINPLTVLNDGGYNASYRDLINFPVLISWPINKTGFETYSFADIINNPPPNFQDKIVIVGSMKDRSLFKVPIAVGDNNYSFSSSAEVGGIVVSNLFNQAEVPFVRTWSDPIEYLYLYGWLIVSGAWILWMCEELDPAKKWAKYILGVVIAGSSFLVCIYIISLFFFPKLWIPSVFVGRGVFFNVVLSSFACLELKVREEQQKVREEQQKVIKEQQQRIEDKERLEKQQQMKIEQLKETVLAQERLAFMGRLSPFIRHKVKNLYSSFDLNLTSNKLDLMMLEEEISTIIDMLTDVNEDESDEIKEKVFNLIQEINKRFISETKIFKSVNELLTRFLPRIRVGNTEYLEPQSLNLNAILTESNSIAIFDLRLIQEDFSAELVLNLTEDLPSVYGLHSELRFIFLNIIENAYYAMFEKLEKINYQPRISITSEVIDETIIRILIEDNGIGIPLEKRPKVFEPFYSTKKNREQTCGIGLTLAKDILEQQYNGKIYLKSIEATCFVIEMPSFSDLHIMETDAP